MIGLTKERAASAQQLFRDWHQHFCEQTNCRAGISPHAPYSARSSLFEFAMQSGLPVATHLAESPAELELLLHHQGPFVDFLKELGVWDPDGLTTGPDHVLQLCHNHKPVLFVHGNYLQPNIEIPANASIVYCPRTHAAFQHPPHPFREFLARGVRVALGTDSLASNPDLSILKEMRFLHARYSDLPGDVILRLGTLSGAQALGCADEFGSLEATKSADFVVLPLANGEMDHPHELWLESTQPVAETWLRGRKRMNS
jgi:cytosine/adenosine deaminase-related metal-dependent hydrolase